MYIIILQQLKRKKKCIKQYSEALCSVKVPDGCVIQTGIVLFSSYLYQQTAPSVL